MKKALTLIAILALFSGGIYWYVQTYGFQTLGNRLNWPQICDVNESNVKCFREWINPIAAVFTMAAIWYAARSVVEANRASDAAVRSTLDNFRQQLVEERELLVELLASKEFEFLNILRQTTRGGWIHARDDYSSLEKIISELSGFPEFKKALAMSVFGGELGQRRRELSRIIDHIHLDYFRCKQQFQREKKVEAGILDNIRFRTKAFIGMMHAYQIAIEEEIDVTAEAINEYDDENLHRVRAALLHRAEREWDKRRKGIFETFVDRISVPIGRIARPKTGNYYEDSTGVSGRTPSPHHVNEDFEVIPKNGDKK